MTLLARVSAALDQAGISHALIGATAMAVHGVSRATQDIDLFTIDPRALDPGTWGSLRAAGAKVEVRRGDDDDPLAGVVRLDDTGERSVDIVVGKRAWQRTLIEEADLAVVGEIQLRVVRSAGLVLLKLFAGGPQDAWDIEQLLLVADRDALVGAVESRLDSLPRDSRALWQRIAGTPRG